MWISPAELILPIRKAGGNPYHDQRGRFTTADGTGSPQPDQVTRIAQYRATVGGESRSEEQARVAAMPPGKRYTGSGPMTDEEWHAHNDYVQRALVQAGADDGMHAAMSTHISEDYTAGVKGNYNDSRRALQNQILAKYEDQAKTVPNERRCIMTGGPMGAGKTTVLRKNAADPGSVAAKLGITYDEYAPNGDGIGSPNNFVVLSADDISEDMARKGMIPQVDHLSPMESSTFVHEEASDLSKDLGDIMVGQGKNVIWDFSMASPGSVLSRMKPLRAEGYHTAGVFVDVPMSQSKASAEHRARKGADEYAAGRGYGGRVPPVSHVMGLASPNAQFRSKNAYVFSQMENRGIFDQTIFVDNANWQNKIIHMFGTNANGKEPMPPRNIDFNNRPLAVGDQVAHLDGSDGMIGTVESVPSKGDADHRVGVYWIMPGKGAIRDKHMPDKLVKTGGPLNAGRDLPDRAGGRTLMGGHPDHAVSAPGREMSWGEFRPYPAPTVDARQAVDDTAGRVDEDQRGWAQAGKPRKARSSGVNRPVDYVR